jgi:hypothetical protein
MADLSIFETFLLLFFSIPIKYLFCRVITSFFGNVEAKCNEDRKICAEVSLESAWINSYLKDKIAAFYCQHMNNIQRKQ